MRFEKDWGRLSLKLSDWKKVKLSELGTIVGGGTPSTKKEEYYGGNIPWITPKDLANFGERYIEHGNRNITLAGLENSSAKILPAGSILFSSRAPIGYIAITANNVTTNQGFKSIIPNSDVDSLFLYYLLKFNKDKIENMGSGTTFKEVSANVMKSIEVFIPTEIAEQRKISAILGAIDDKIENNKKINHHLEEMATSIFENMFPNVSSGKSTIGNYIIPKRGKNLLSKDAIVGKVPVVAGGLQPSTFHNIANTKSPVLTISASGANAGYVNLWHIPVWSSDSSYIDTSITDNVYFWYVMLKKRQQEIYDSQTGSAQPHIYPKHIEIMPTIDLSEDKVSRFTKQVTPLFESIGNNIKEIGELQTLRDTLLPKLLSGEIPVNQATK